MNRKMQTYLFGTFNIRVIRITDNLERLISYDILKGNTDESYLSTKHNYKVICIILYNYYYDFLFYFNNNLFVVE